MHTRSFVWEIYKARKDPTLNKKDAFQASQVNPTLQVNMLEAKRKDFEASQLGPLLLQHNFQSTKLLPCVQHNFQTNNLVPLLSQRNLKHPSW